MARRRTSRSLKWKSAKAGAGKVRVGKSYSGEPLLVEKQTYTAGIGTHAASVIVYDLPAGAERFTGEGRDR